MDLSINSTTTLNNGVEMPWLGLGVFRSQEGREVEDAVRWALELGYRHIDTASLYGNEAGVGRAIAASNVPREEIFITTKVWNEDVRHKRTLKAFEESLNRLGTDYIDLYLVHWPVPDLFTEVWTAMEKLYASGKVRAIGVSNYLVPHLETLLAVTDVVPAVNQVEFHPRLQQPELYNYCVQHGIQLEAWAPIMKGQASEVPTLAKIAEKHGKTAVQVVLRWDLQRRVVTIPKSSKQHRIEANAQLFDFALSDDEIAQINALDQQRRLGPDPANFSF